MKISERAREFVWDAERQLSEVFQRIDSVESVTQMRVLDAFQAHGVAARHFAPTTGYGYDDIGRDTLDLVFADAMQADAALVRPQFVNGTHAIFTVLAGDRAGDAILSITGRPYDTLEEAVGTVAMRRSRSAGLAYHSSRYRCWRMAELIFPQCWTGYSSVLTELFMYSVRVGMVGDHRLIRVHYRTYFRK